MICLKVELNRISQPKVELNGSMKLSVSLKEVCPIELHGGKYFVLSDGQYLKVSNGYFITK